MLPPITGPLSTERVAPEDIKMKFVSEDCGGLDLFPGADNIEKADCLNKLVVIWVAAIEKVRTWESDGIKAQATESEWGHLPPPQIDFSQIDPWRVAVPCPWRIDKPALVKLFFWSRPSKNKHELREFWKPPFPFQRTLSESDSDGIILLENLVDTREFFMIEVANPKDYARAELEKIERELCEKERTLRRLGMEDTRFTSFLALEEAPFETLSAREQQGLKTAREKLGLEWHRALLKNWSGV